MLKVKTLVQVFFSLFLGLASVNLWAQGSSQGAISGTISDASGGLVAGVEVTAINPETNFRLVTTSSESGNYALSPLPVGRYQVSASLTGFKTFRQEPIVVSTALTTRLDIRLDVGEVTQSIDITGTPAPLQTTNAELSTLVERRAILDLPLQLSQSTTAASGRRQVDSFVFLTPGVTGDQFSKSFNGSPNLTQEVIIDGVSHQIAETPGVLGFIAPPYEAVEEFNVQSTLYPVELGRGFGVTNFALKSGTNSLHGSLFEFLRNDKLDARGFFQDEKPIVRQNEYGFALGGPIKRDETFFFGSYSGFKRRGGTRNFGLVSLPTARMKRGDFSQLLPLGIQIFDPATTRPDGQGGFVRDLFPGNIIPDHRISPIAKRLIPFIPDPDDDRPFDNFLSRATSPIDDDVWSVKIDHQISQRQKLMFSYWWDRSPSPVIGDIPGDLNRGYLVDQTGGGIRLNHLLTLRPNLLNYAAFGYGMRRGSFLAVSQTVGNAILGIPNLPDLPGFPGFIFDEYAALGSLDIAPWPVIDHLYNFVDTVSWTKGKHQFKFGVDFRFHQTNGRNEAQVGGELHFSKRGTSQPNSPDFGSLGDSFSSLLLSQVDYGIRLVSTGTMGLRTSYTGGFIQDNYKITPKLTIDYGLRIERSVPQYEAYDRFSHLGITTPNPGAGSRPGALIFAGTGPGRIGSRTFADTKIDFAPRLGLAYALNDKTVLRAGYGLFYALSNGSGLGIGQGSYLTGFQFPQFLTTTDNGITPAFLLDDGFPPFTEPFPNLDPAIANDSVIDYFNSEAGTSAYMQNWTLDLQRELPGQVLLDWAYAGQKGTHLPANLENLNQVHPQFLSLGPLLNADISSPEAAVAGIPIPYPGFSGSVAQALRPFPQYAGINEYYQPLGNSTYHAVQAKLQKRFSQELSFLVSYTFSKTLTDTGQSGFAPFNNAFPLDTYNRKLEKTIGPEDRTQNLVASFVYDLPFGSTKRFANRKGVVDKIIGGWAVSGIATYRNGPPLGIGGGPRLPLFNGPNRPNRVPGVDMRTGVSAGDFDPASDLYLNVAAFETPAPFTFGNLAPRLSAVRGFPFYNEGLALIKRTSITETHRFEFRTEFFNVFNRVIFANPASNINNPGNFGRVFNQLNSPRVIQFGMKYIF